jgi:hypothetical protein
MTDTIRDLWAAVAQHPCPGDARSAEQPRIDVQRAFLYRLVDAYQDAGDEDRGLFLAKLLALPPARTSGYVFHFWDATHLTGRNWVALGLPTDGDPNAPDGGSPEACFEELFEKFATDL